MEKTQIINKRIENLRQLMEKKDIDAYIIFTNDYHGSEYIGDYFKCREYITGFTGSAGTCVIGKDYAMLWTDGRYFIQAADQIANTELVLCKSGEVGCPSIIDVLKENNVKTIGFDGKVVSTNFARNLKSSIKDVKIIPNYDLVGEIWEDRPQISKEKAFVLPIEYSGEDTLSKIEKVRKNLKATGCDYLVLTSLDDIAWLLNIRGNDVLCNPVVLSYVLISNDEVKFYCHKEVLDEQTNEYFKDKNIIVAEYFDIYEDVKHIQNKVIAQDLSKTNYALVSLYEKNNVLKHCRNYTTELKAVKNKTEIKNSYEAHILDGVAVTKFIYWLKTNIGKTKITEISAANVLYNLRKRNESFKGLSFETISGYGHHGAIVHYDPTPETDIELHPKSFLLVDSGGQYLGATTDITRTISLGELTDEEKTGYTSVLQGHLAVADAKFPQGTCGCQLDILARSALWKQGLDFNHSTGHGVGSYLNVHEGPQSIGKNPAYSNYPFKEGMITSNEPGLYIEGKFGVRIENLMVCLKQANGFLRFDDLTVVPYDIDAIDRSLLTEKEKDLIHAYHERVYNTLKDYLTEDEKSWLQSIVEAI